MKTLSLSRPLIIMMAGPPGAGKSFFARQFSETFGVPVVSTDRLRYELFDTPTFNKDEHDIIARLADYQASELLKTKRSFLIDGGCNTLAERQKHTKSAAKHGYDSLIIWVQTDPPTAKLRATKRKDTNPGDMFNPSLTLDQFAKATNAFAPPLREQYVVISGKHAYSTQAKMVLRKLAAPHTQQAEAAHQQERNVVQRPRPGLSTPSAGPRSVLIR